MTSWASLRPMNVYGEAPDEQEPGRRCADCGARLNRYNPGLRCSPCRSRATRGGPPLTAGAVKAASRARARQGVKGR